jgi:hypothetical protein
MIVERFLRVDLRDQVLDLSAEYKRTQKVQQGLVEDLTKLLGEERHKILKMEKDKRAIENTVCRQCLPF